MLYPVARSVAGSLGRTYLDRRTPRVGGTMEIGGQELLVLAIVFAVPMAVAAWVLRR